LQIAGSTQQRLKEEKLSIAQRHAFISYVRENKDVIDRLATNLRALGVKVWLDRDDIVPGMDWKLAIRKAIQDGVFFIACFSKELNERSEAFMHGELRLAIDRLRNMPKDRVWFIPIIVNETEIPSHSISDHEILSDIHAVKLYDNWDNGIKTIFASNETGRP
jgi:hypothetical protein